MIKNTLIALGLFLAILFAISCKARKELKQDTLVTRSKDSTGLKRDQTSQVDTTKKVSTAQSSSTETGIRETTVYPTKGKPFTINNGETFTGEVDSTKTKTTYHKSAKKRKEQVVNTGKSANTTKTDSTATHDQQKARVQNQQVETTFDIVRTLEAIGAVILICGAFFLYHKLRGWI